MLKIRQTFNLNLSLLFALTLLFCQEKAFSQNQNNDAGQSPTFHMTGDVNLLSNFVRGGLTQTEQDPALQGSFWFNFGPQFRLGVWGSNVSYKNESAHFNLQLCADIKVAFSPNAQLVLSYADDQYFDADHRRGKISSFALKTFDLTTSLNSISNWEGTSDSASYYRFTYKFKFAGSWELDAKVGYMSLNSADYNSYIDTGAEAIYRGSQINGLVGINYAENHFSRGGVQFYVGAQTSF